MQPPRDIEGAVHRAAGHQLGCQQRGAGAENGRVVHSWIVGVVALETEVEAVSLLNALSRAQTLHRCDVIGGMQPQQLIFSRRPRSYQAGILVVESAIGLQELVGVA